MREQDLAAVLFDQGIRSGLTMERVIDELGAVNWPSFVDAKAFREALAGAAEHQLRRQMEDQLAMIRRKIGSPSAASALNAALTPSAPADSPAPRSVPPPATPVTPPVQLNSNPQPTAAAPQPAPQPATPPSTPAPAPAEPVVVGRVMGEPEPVEDDEDTPNDATMVWITQTGQKPKPE